MDGPTPFDLPLSKVISLLGSIANIFPSLCARRLILFLSLSQESKKNKGVCGTIQNIKRILLVGSKLGRKYNSTFHHMKKWRLGVWINVWLSCKLTKSLENKTHFNHVAFAILCERGFEILCETGSEILFEIFFQSLESDKRFETIASD